MKSGVCKAVQNKWSGDERWMETLIYGQDFSKDMLLSVPFDRVCGAYALDD